MCGGKIGKEYEIACSIDHNLITGNLASIPMKSHSMKLHLHNRIFSAKAVIFCLLLARSASADLIAITEYMAGFASGSSNPTSFVELFNYGSSTVNLENWKLKDEGSNDFTLPSFTLNSGEFVVFTENKSAFEIEWFSSTALPNVVEWNQLVLVTNQPDEIILENSSGTTVFNVAYIHDETAGQSTYLTESTISRTDWGSNETGGAQIDRDGHDLGISGLVGFEKQNATLEAASFTSVGDMRGSPLAGSYAAIPEPSAVLFGGLLCGVLGVNYARKRLQTSK